jgi:hypothetical protein
MSNKANTREQNKGQPSEERMHSLAFRKLTKSLSSPKGNDISLSCEADLGARYKRLLQEVKSFVGPIDISVGNQIHSSVFRAVPQIPKKMNGSISLSRESFRLATEILNETVRRCAQHSRDVRGVEALIKRCGSTLIDLAKGEQHGFGWTQVTSFYQKAAASSGLPFEVLASESNLGAAFTTVQDGLAEGLMTLLDSGEVVEVRQILATCNHHPDLNETCQRVLRNALSLRAGTLPRESQLVAMRQLGINIESERVDYANPAESPEMRQAAALLLFLFDTRNHSPELEEAFDRFRAVAQNQFSLYLRGEVESAMKFDPRIHESPEDGDPNSTTLVKMIRPWVEWYKPPDARVVIRGIVETRLTARREQG